MRFQFDAYFICNPQSVDNLIFSLKMDGYLGSYDIKSQLNVPAT